jgi:hypothetical protein
VKAVFNGFKKNALPFGVFVKEDGKYIATRINKTPFNAANTEKTM